VRQIYATRYAPDRRSSPRGFPLSILETRLQEANDRRFIDRRRAGGSGAIHFPQKMRNFLRPYAEEAFCRGSQSTARSRLIYGLPRNSQQ